MIPFNSDYVCLTRNTSKIDDIFLNNRSDVFAIYDEKVVSFLHTLSQKIFSFPKTAMDPALASLAFWLRKSNILSLKELVGESIRRPRGLAFHICPSNVDTMFVYSWAISLLMGNRNIVRVSSRASDRLRELISIVDEVLAIDVYKNIAENNAVITYKHSKDITDYISARCDVRIIWGGDGSINLIRQSPTKASASDVIFADRSSCSIFNEQAVRGASDQQKKSLYKNFFNDTYTYLQKACSSPRVLFWVGDLKLVLDTQNDFWLGFQKYVSSSGVDIPMSLVSEKIASMQYLAMRSTECIMLNNYKNMYATSAVVSDINTSKTEVFVGGGFFLNKYIFDFSEVFKDVDDKFQTCTYYGFSKQEIQNFVSEQKVVAGVDRWVPVGKALEFNPIWDGYNLFHECSKEVSFI